MALKFSDHVAVQAFTDSDGQLRASTEQQDKTLATFDHVARGKEHIERAYSKAPAKTRSREELDASSANASYDRYDLVKKRSVCESVVDFKA